MTGLTVMAQTSLMTYNIRYNTPRDGENRWDLRKAEVVELIERYHPAIFGIQEGLYDQVEYLDKQLSNYAYIGVGRDDGDEKGEFAALFYNINTYKLINNYTYWLSETPEKVSVGWDAAMERITTYGVFLNKISGDTLHVFNCHYDHMGPLARENSSQLILELILQKDLLNKPLVVMGDLNARPKDKPLTILTEALQDCYTAAAEPVGPFGTFNNFDPNHSLEDRIDYILLRNLAIKSYQAINDKRRNGLYPSDHLPVYVEAEFY
jgi:endonuclease/exonuclease/phosphatase family metal-dependent hydrolase